MPRRASKSINPLWIIIVCIVVIGAVILGRAFFGELDDPYRTIPELDVATYLENSDALRGNVYKADGMIDSSLAWSPVRGRLIAIEVQATPDNALLPVLVPPDLSDINIQKGQSFLLQLEVVEDGILLAKDLKKS